MFRTDTDEDHARGLCAVLYPCSAEFVLRVVPADLAASSVSTLERDGGAATESFEAPPPAQPPHAGVQALREQLIAEMDVHVVDDADRNLVLQPLAALHARVGAAELAQVRRLLLAALRLVLHARWNETPVRARQAHCVSRFACGADASSFPLLVPAACHALEREAERLDRLWLEQIDAVQVQDVGWLVSDAYLSARRFLRRAVSGAGRDEVRRTRPAARAGSTSGWTHTSMPRKSATSA
ncbi:MAG: hypothetical protein ING59_10585 [Burkholderiales bacterium]|jgi:hypothetical protein|nr:hypothetical protein [Burkholderiales bacterium]